MTESSPPSFHEPAHSSPAAVRHLKWFGLTTIAGWSTVIVINLIAFQMIVDPRNQSAAQLITGWERTYKPIVFERLDPQIASFGASWARDAFDPQTVSAISGRRFFNFAVSAGQPYEIRRFLQSAAAHGTLQQIVLNLDSFVTRPHRLRHGAGFNESLLSTNADGSVNSSAARSRLIAVTLSGASLGYNFSVGDALWRMARGQSRTEVLPAYERRDYSAARAELERARATILGGAGNARSGEQPINVRLASDEFERTLRIACDHGIEVFSYFTPHHATSPFAIDRTPLKLELLDVLARTQQSCASRIHYFDFSYPNFVTLEALLQYLPSSRYYRPDDHPRPAVGELMVARMLGKALPSDRTDAAADFGVDLLALERPQAVAWITTRQARWRGQWTEPERAAVLQSLRTTPPGQD